MLAVVTGTKLLPMVLQRAATRVEDAGGPQRRVQTFPTLLAAVEKAPTAAFLVVDLNAVKEQDDLLELLVRWTAGNLTGQLVLIEPAMPTQWIGRALYDIPTVLKERANHPLVSAERAVTDSTLWEEMLLAHPFATVMEQLRCELEAALPKSFPNKSLIWHLFAHAPKNVRVSDYFDTSGLMSEKAQRHTIGAALRHGKQACPRDIITAFRVYIFLRLKELNRDSGFTEWPSDIVVQHLDPEQDHRKFRRSFKERTGLTITELQRIPASEVRNCIVNLLTPSKDQRPFKEHVQHMRRAAPIATKVAGALRYLTLACIIPMLWVSPQDDDDGPDPPRRPAVVFVGQAAVV